MSEAARASSRSLRFGAGSLLVALCVALGVAAAAQAPAGGRSPSPDKTIPTLPPSTGDIPSTVTDTALTETTAAAAPTEPSSPPSTEATADAGMPLPVLFALASNALGSNQDIAAGLTGFAAIPDGVPTPARASIDRISVSYSAETESYVAIAAFSTPATVDDVTAYYQTVLTAGGFVLRGDESGSEVRELQFARPASEFDGAGVTLTIEGTAAAAVELVITDHANPASVGAFTGWPAGLPGIADGRPVEAIMSATSEDGPTLELSTTYRFAGVSADDLTSRIRDGLAAGGGGFRVADSDQGGATIALDHAVIDDVSATISEVDGSAQLVIEGTVD